jgi:hypothetical protein
VRRVFFFTHTFSFLFVAVHHLLEVSGRHRASTRKGARPSFALLAAAAPAAAAHAVVHRGRHFLHPPRPLDLILRFTLHHVAVQVECESKGLKPGNYISGARIKTRLCDSICTAPPRARRTRAPRRRRSRPSRQSCLRSRPSPRSPGGRRSRRSWSRPRHRPRPRPRRGQRTIPAPAPAPRPPSGCGGGVAEAEEAPWPWDVVVAATVAVAPGCSGTS